MTLLRWLGPGTVALGVACAAIAGLALRRDSAPVAAGSEPAIRDEEIVLQVFEEGDWWTVEIHALLFDDGSGDYAAAAAESRDAIRERFDGAITANDAGGATAQFVQAGYWWPARIVEWGYNPAGAPPGISSETVQVTAAATTWNLSGARWNFLGGEYTTAGTGGCQPAGRDSHNTVGWADQAGSTLAITCTWYASSAPRPSPANEFDMEIDPAWGWTVGAPVGTDLQSVITHEFGHALGLDHTQASCPGAVMCASYHAGKLLHQLTPDDIQGILGLYGPGAAPAGPFRAYLPATRKD